MLLMREVLGGSHAEGEYEILFEGREPEAVAVEVNVAAVERSRRLGQLMMVAELSELEREGNKGSMPGGQDLISAARDVTSQPDGWWQQVRPVARTRSSGTASRVPAMRGP